MRFVLLFLLLGSAALAETGRVVGVHDGDTLTILVGGRHTFKVRLFGIDAPETRQAFGSVAKRKLSELAFGEQVEFWPKQKDRYGRTVSKILLPDGEDAGAEMIRSGLAWHYVAYARKETTYARLEREARQRRIGLWREPNPVAPWLWRKKPKAAAAAEE